MQRYQKILVVGMMKLHLLAGTHQLMGRVVGQLLADWNSLEQLSLMNTVVELV